MEHKHSVFDTDTHFTIDPITRQIKNASHKKTTLMQFDHNSERFTFECPRYIEAHDMAECNKVEVHYLNIDGNRQNSGVYVVDDFQVMDGDETQVTCSWVISANATQLAGTLSFLLRFLCVDGDIITYSWNTDMFTAQKISKGIDASGTFETEYADVIEQWKASVMGYFSSSIAVWKDETSAAIREETFEHITALAAYVTPQMFGAKGDGVTDDTSAFIAMIHANPSMIIIPNGTYRVTQIDFSGLSGCRVMCGGQFVNGNTTDVYGVIVAGGVDNVFDGLKIDGNADAFSETTARYGEVCALLINTNATGCIFRNTTIEDAQYCGVIFNNGVTNCQFYNTRFRNIGEHCFYVGGVNSVLFDGVEADTWGNARLCVSNGHDCEIVKQANRASVDIKVRNIAAVSENGCMAYGFNINDCDGFEIDGAKFDTDRSFILGGQNVVNFKVRGAKVTGALSMSYFNSPATFTDCDLVDIGHFSSRLTFDNCRFVINYAECYVADMVCNHCRFEFVSSTVRLYEHENITFNDCAIVSLAETAQGQYMFTDMNANEEVYIIVLNNSLVDTSNYSGAFYANKKSNLRFSGCDLTKLNGNSGVLTLTMRNCVCKNTVAWSGWDSEAANCSNVITATGVSTSKIRKTVTIPASETVASVGGLRYVTFRKCTVADIVVMNTTNNSCVYAELVDSTDNQTLRIVARDAVNEATSVVVIIDLNE